MKKAIVWVTCMALALGMTGCGSAANDSTVGSEEAAASEVQEAVAESSEAETAAEEDTDTAGEENAAKDYTDVGFRIAWWGGDSRNTQTVEIIENFEKQYPNLKIDVEYGNYGDYFTKLTTQATAGNLPDVYMMDYSRINEYEVCGTDRGIPINAEMRDYIFEKATETGKRELEFINFLSDGVATPISAPAPTGSAEADAYVNEVMEQLYYGQLEKDEILGAVAAAVEQGEAILAKAASE